MYNVLYLNGVWRTSTMVRDIDTANLMVFIGSQRAAPKLKWNVSLACNAFIFSTLTKAPGDVSMSPQQLILCLSAASKKLSPVSTFIRVECAAVFRQSFQMVISCRTFIGAFSSEYPSWKTRLMKEEFLTDVLKLWIMLWIVSFSLQLFISMIHVFRTNVVFELFTSVYFLLCETTAKLIGLV